MGHSAPPILERQVSEVPAEQRGSALKLPSGRWRLRWYDAEGKRRSGGGAFQSKSEALRHFREMIEPELDGRAVVRKDVTLQDLVDTFLERHVAEARTIKTLRQRLAYPLKKFGDVPVVELEGMGDEIAAFEATLPPRYRYSVSSALRQTLRAGIAYGYLTRSPITWANPQPKPRAIRVFTAAEIKSLTQELGSEFGAMIVFASETGLRPGEWSKVERRDVDRKARRLTVRGTKTLRSHREVPLTSRALDALEELPLRIGYLFPNADGGPLNLNGFSRREWRPAVEAAGIATPARLYDLRSTFASNALARGITVYELARIMGTSIEMIERHYGALLDTAHDSLLERLEAAEGGGR